MVYLLLALSYVAGATPTSYWVGRVVHGIDLREHGSGNLGATNSFRVLGATSAAPVIIVDVAKGFLPVWFFPGMVGVGQDWALGFGVAAVIGHVFSMWVGFKGGKGIATSAGVFLALAPWAVLGGFLIWSVLVFSTGFVSLGSMVAAITLPVLIFFTPHRGGEHLVTYSLPLVAFIVWAHRSNIQRLLAGEEPRFRRNGAAPDAPSSGSDGEGT